MSANKQEVFGILEENEGKSDDEWIVRGRVYTIITLGQTVYVYLEENGEQAEFTFHIAEIRFYNKNVDELTEGLTCELTLKGNNPHILTKASRLLA